MSKDGWIGSEQPEKNESQEEQRRRMPEFMMAVMLLIAVFLVSRQAGLMVSGQAVAAGVRRPVVVLDSGHGGNDPGKIGVDGSLEKEINLQIARRLKTYLEASDVTVVMTREDDRGLYEETNSSKKMADMKNRCGKIAEAEPDLVVSIHQNSYHQESVSGGQVFYYKTSERGKRLAEILQRRFDYVLGEKNTRTGKAERKLLPSSACKAADRDCGMRFFVELERGCKSEFRRVPGPAGLDDPCGNYGVSESEEILLIFMENCTIVKAR